MCRSTAWANRTTGPAKPVRGERLQKRASDLLSKWVGETGQRIADAFAEACDAKPHPPPDRVPACAGRRLGEWLRSQGQDVIDSRDFMVEFRYFAWATGLHSHQ